MQHDDAGATSVIAVSTQASWFSLSHNTAITDTSCNIKQYELCIDSNCVNSWTDTAKIKINTALASTAGSPQGTFYPITIFRNVGYSE